MKVRRNQNGDQKQFLLANCPVNLCEMQPMRLLEMGRQRGESYNSKRAGANGGSGE